jgi:hypothetical protein
MNCHTITQHDGAPEGAATTTELLTRVELGQRWKKSIRTLKRWEKEGRLNPLTLGPRTIRYRLGDILQFEKESESVR